MILRSLVMDQVHDDDPQIGLQIEDVTYGNVDRFGMDRNGENPLSLNDFFACGFKIRNQLFVHITFQKIPECLYLKPFWSVLDKVCEKDDHDSGVFPAKSPCEVNAAGIAHVDVQECKIIGRKVFDRAGIAERIKVRRDAAFFAMVSEQCRNLLHDSGLIITNQ